MSQRNYNKLLIDLLALVSFLVSMDPRSSGIPVHEWLTIAMTGVAIVHLLLNWDWIVAVTQRFSFRITTATQFNYVLNWTLFIDAVLLMLSGILISRSVMPFIGMPVPESRTWRGLHDMSANIFLVLLGVHLATHWQWITVHGSRLLARLTGRRAQKVAS